MQRQNISRDCRNNSQKQVGLLTQAMMILRKNIYFTKEIQKTKNPRGTGFMKRYPKKVK